MKKEANQVLAIAAILIVAIIAALLIGIKVIDANQAQDRANNAVGRLAN